MKYENADILNDKINFQILKNDKNNLVNLYHKIIMDAGDDKASVKHRSACISAVARLIARTNKLNVDLINETQDSILDAVADAVVGQNFTQEMIDELHSRIETMLPAVLANIVEQIKDEFKNRSKGKQWSDDADDGVED